VALKSDWSRPARMVIKKWRETSEFLGSLRLQLSS